MKLVARLSPRWRLMDDGVQWHVQVRRTHKGAVSWQGVSWIATRDPHILMRVLRSKAMVGEGLDLTYQVLRLLPDLAPAARWRDRTAGAAF